MGISVDSRATAVDGDESITACNFLNFASEGVINMQLATSGIPTVKDWDDLEKSNIAHCKFNQLTPAIDEACLTL
jgi:hypothetical protein